MAELDHLSRVMVQQIRYEAGPRCIPLIQAGGWLAGANVVAGALEASGRSDVATSLLKHPEVVSYFLSYVRSEGQNTNLPPVMGKVESALTTLQAIANKSVIGPEDVRQVYSTTGEVLSLL